MQKILFGVLSFFTTLFFLFSVSLFFSQPALAHGGSHDYDNDKVTICHATPPDDAKNGYNQNTVDEDSILHGEGHDGHGADIIPPFTYWSKDKVCEEVVDEAAHWEHRSWIETTYKWEYQNRSVEWVCPDSDNAYNSNNSNKPCSREFTFYHLTYFKYANKVPQYENCPDGWQVKPGDDSKCRRQVVDVEGHWGPWQNGKHGGDESRWVEATYKTECDWKWVEHKYDGKHWDDEGKAIYENDCVVPPVDECTNLEENTIPENYYQTENRECFPKDPVCTDPQANNDVELTEQTYSDNRLCTYDGHPYCVNGETVTILDNESVPEGATQGACEPKPTPTPTPEPGKGSSLEVSSLSCTNRNFDAIVKLTNNNQPAAGINVLFKYHGVEYAKQTDIAGKAQVGYTFESEESVFVTPSDGYPAQSQHILDTKDTCEKRQEVVVANTQITKPQAMAETGVFEDVMVKVLGFVGGSFTMIGAALFGKRNA